jgi:HK97 gp10 family phage protein
MAKRGRYSRVDTKKLQRIARQLPQRLDAVGRKAAAEMVADVVGSFGTSPPGVTYQLYSPRRTHVASVAGYPPNSDTGALRASIEWETAGKLRYAVLAGTEYAAWLEFGTRDMAARPFLTPVFDEWRARKLRDLLKNEGLFD